MKILQPEACEIITRNQMGIMFVRGVRVMRPVRP